MIDYQLMFGYAGICLVLQTIFVFTAPYFIPNFQKMTKANQKTTPNKLISTVHATIMFSRTAYYWTVLNRSMEMPSVSIPYEEFTIHIMMGYLIFDTGYELFNDRDYTALAHHVLGFTSHFFTLYYNHGSGSFYSMMVYIAELSTPFLNISWLMNSASLTDSPLFLLNVIVLMVSFLFCRIFMGPYFFYHLVTSWVTQEGEHPFLFYLNIVIVLSFNVLNFYWYGLLLKLALRKLSPAKKKSREE